MQPNAEFCTCTDLNCPNHPTRHDRGCTPCIAKNLACGEIPSCFFNKFGNAEKRTGYTVRDFAREILGK